MTLGDMRANGVQSLDQCNGCRRRVIVNDDRLKKKSPATKRGS
jgi:hypothetical protein